MKYAIAFCLLMACSAVGEKHETHKFVVLYMADEGCVGYHMEGGCDCLSTMQGRWFDTRAGALKWLNEMTAQDGRVTILSSAFGTATAETALLLSSRKSMTADDVIGIFAVTEMPAKFAETEKTYETYEQKSEKVIKPVKEWR